MWQKWEDQIAQLEYDYLFTDEYPYHLYTIALELRVMRGNDILMGAKDASYIVVCIGH